MLSTINAFLASWRRAWNDLGLHAPDGLYDRLLAAYAEPQRKYHTLQHLEKCLETLARCPVQAHHTGEIELALWFHDAIYDVERTDNETLSADWAADALFTAGAPAAAIEHVRGLILATRHAGTPESLDEQLLVDIDLAILGAHATRFAEYGTQVRQEYAWVPEDLFREKRCAILRLFLSRPTIYGTPFFHDTLEARARENLQRSIAILAH